MSNRLYEIAFQIGGKIAGSFPKSLTSAAGQMSQLSKQIAQLESAQGQVTRFQGLHKQIEATGAKLRAVEADKRKLDQQMRTIPSPALGGLAQQFDAATVKSAKLRTELQLQLHQLQGMKSAMAAAGVSTQTLGADSARIAGQMAKAQAQQKLLQAHQGAVAANQKAREAAKAKFDESKGNLVGAAAGVAAVAVPAVIAAKFEDSMVRAGALAHATDQQMAQLTATARQLGRDTRFSASQAAEGMGFLAQSGFKANEILAAMPGMLNIAAAGMVSVGDASDITSNILRGFGMQAGQAGRMGDVLTNTFTNSNTTLAQLGLTMSYVAPIAQASGMSLEKASAAIGVLANAGIKGEKAGTAMRAMLDRLVAPPKKARDALAALGVKTKDAAGNAIELDQVLASLNKKMAKMGSGKKLGLVSEIFGQEAATGAVVLMAGQASGALAEMTTKVSKSGSAAEIAAKMNATAAGQLDNLKGSAEDVNIALGNRQIPTFKHMVDQMVPVINSVTAWMERNPKLTETLILGATAVAGMNLALATSGAALNGIILGVKTAQGAILAFKGATVAGMLATAAPIALVAAGVAGLAAIGYQLYSNWGPIMQWWDEQWDKMFDSVADMVNQVTPLLRGLGFDVGDMRKGVFKTFGRGDQYAAMAQKLAQFQKYGAPQDPNAEPDWLQKNPANKRFPAWAGTTSAAIEGRMAGAKKLATSQTGVGRLDSAGLLDAANKLDKGKGGKGDVFNFTHTANITLPEGATHDTRINVDRAVQASERDFEAQMKRYMDRQRSRSFGP